MLPGNLESPGDGSESGDVETGSGKSPTSNLVTVPAWGSRVPQFGAWISCDISHVDV